MNAGGKKAVLWGTALDNLASLAHGHARRAMARGDAAGPQSRQDPRRRGGALRAEALRRRRQARSSAPSILEIPGAHFRKAGLGKDVTDKFLAGLPGIQKEGCDGLITSARWIVHRMPAHARTVCLEFFGNAPDAVPSIVEIKDFCSPADGRASSRGWSTWTTAT